MSSLSSPWIAKASFLSISQSPSFAAASNVNKHHTSPLSPSSVSTARSFRVLCGLQYVANDLKFVLHDALDASGVDTTHARAAREGFSLQIKKLSSIERETSISINRGVDLGRTTLYIAAEDDSLVSHSSVPLPVDAFVQRLDNLSMEYCSQYSSSLKASPECFIESLEKYMYVDKGFRRITTRNQLEPRALYLHSVLTHRAGSAAMLSLIYSEILKMIRLRDLLRFDVEIFYPLDPHSLPRGYHKQKSKMSDQSHIMTSQSLLVEILRHLKDAFWPFQHDRTKSLFLRAALAANCMDTSNTDEESGFEVASAKAAQHRLERGVWTSVRFGDMRRALSACERLILLGADSKELRDYSILLYRCGFYKESFDYLKLYENTKAPFSNSVSDLEEEAAVEKLMIRLNLILSEEGWSTPSYVKSFFNNTSEPW